MKRIVKKLATLIFTVGFISISCATGGFGGQMTSLGGNPRVETIGTTIGMTLIELDKELGTPVSSDSCVMPFTARGQESGAQGRSFMWVHEFANIPEAESRISGIVVCTIQGVVVAEHREWMLKTGDLIQTGQADTMDRGRVQEIMDGLLKANPSQYRIEHLHRNKGIEI